MRGDLGAQCLVDIVGEGVQRDTGDDFQNFRIAVTGSADLLDLAGRNRTASIDKRPGEFDGGSSLRIVRRTAAVGVDLVFIQLGELRARIGVRTGSSRSHCFGHCERDPLAGCGCKLALAESTLQCRQAVQGSVAVRYQAKDVRDGADQLLDRFEHGAGCFRRIVDRGWRWNARHVYLPDVSVKGCPFRPDEDAPVWLDGECRKRGRYSCVRCINQAHQRSSWIRFS